MLKCISSLIAALLLLATPVYAQDEEGGEGEDGATQTAEIGGSYYISLKPPFVANYGESGRLKFMRVEIALRIDTSFGTGPVRHHMPAIRNAIVSILSKQTEEDVASQEGKELLRVSLLEAVQEVVVAEEGSHEISDLLFNAFIVQS